MIKGIKNHLDTSIRYDQTQGAWENFLKELMMEFINEGKLSPEDAVYLFTCGMSAFSTEMEGLGYLKPSMYFTFPGKAHVKVQMDDAHMAIPMTPKYEIFKNKPDNYFLDTYVYLAELLYDCPAYRLDNMSFSNAADLLSMGEGIQVCLKNPLHWIAPVDYDNEADEIRFHDSWAGRPGLVNGGVHEPLRRLDWDNVQPSIVVYPKVGSAI